jgi:hypothetical protein
MALDRLPPFAVANLFVGPRDYVSSVSAASILVSIGVGPNCEAIRLASVRFERPERASFWPCRAGPGSSRIAR